MFLIQTCRQNPALRRQASNRVSSIICAMLMAGFSIDAPALPDEAAPASAPVTDAKDPGRLASGGEPALLVVDSSSTLSSFDADGKALQQTQFKPELGKLTGGMALAMGKVYVTWVQPSGQWGGVVAFDRLTLRQVRLHIGAFAPSDRANDPGAGRGIIWDPERQRFYIATEHQGLLAFDRAGGPIPMTGGTAVPTLAVAYDSASHSPWTIDDHGQLARWSDDGAQTPGFRVRGVNHSRAASMSYCPAGEGSDPIIAVALRAAKAESRAAGAVQIFDSTGKSLSFHGAKIADPHALSCSSRGELFVAAGTGLLEFKLQGPALTPPGDLARLSAPLYGVLAVY
jgi:hypothetical protein